MAKVESELVKKARENIRRLIALEMRKEGFTPSTGGAMPPSGATAMDPAAMGAPGGAPPMDPSMGGGAPPPEMGMPPVPPDAAGGAPIIQATLPDLMQMIQMVQGGGGAAPAPAEGGAPGAPNEPAKPKGGKGQALEGKIDALMTKVDKLLGFFAAVSGVSPQQLLEGGSLSGMGTSAPMEGMGGEALLPQVGGGGEAPPPAPAPAPPLQPQASAKKPQALRLHELVGNLLK